MQDIQEAIKPRHHIQEAARREDLLPSGIRSCGPQRLRPEDARACCLAPIAIRTDRGRTGRSDRNAD